MIDPIVRRQPIHSSVIASLGFDDRENVLEVEFQSGKLYRFFLVPRSAFDALLEAESIGAHFNHEIRPRYRGVEVADED